MQEMEISKSGIKTSILSFISDYSISFFIVAFFLISYYFPVFDHPLKNLIACNFSIEIKVFILILLLLLTYPIGVIINGLSWFFLSWMEKWFEVFHFTNSCFLTAGTKRYLCFELLKKHYNLSEFNFYEITRETEAHLLANHEELLSVYDKSLGESILFRNITFCLLILMIYFLVKIEILSSILLFCFAILFIIFNSVVSFYYSLAVLLLNWKFERKIKKYF